MFLLLCLALQYSGVGVILEFGWVMSECRWLGMCVMFFFLSSSACDLNSLRAEQSVLF